MRLPNSVGRYRVERELGKGAMGRVLLCHDPVLDRNVALKHLRTDLAIAPEQREPLLDRMRQEARASARVSHPHLVALHDMGEDPHVGLFLVFEYVEGPTLKERLEQGPLPPNRSARLARELGSAMRVAHHAGVLHRDIKPDNVILSDNGAKLADFGIARMPDSTLTQGGSVLGTPAYSAPEAVGEGNFSPGSDQFSLAATLYEAISSSRAFPGDDAVAVATLIANEEPRPIANLAGLDSAVDRVLLRAMSKTPAQRYPDCEQFASALAEALLPSGRREMATLPDAHHAFQPEPVASKSSTPLVFGAALVGAICAWAGARWLSPDPAPAQSIVVVQALEDEDEDEANPVAWLAERPAKPSPGALNAATGDGAQAPGGRVKARTPAPKTPASPTAPADEPAPPERRSVAASSPPAPETGSAGPAPTEPQRR